ncbi:hypothetical protein [Streptomyces sp. Ag82_O1-15]|uniref:hypothetical protein n=1 Tax=Streptomyces sp. Ag82_O1-15 TaxID=1938855 RepID=UPI00117FFC84|nr:hypothetical protein [Streptomyces sp. Ag82_O1-15]
MDQPFGTHASLLVSLFLPVVAALSSSRCTSRCAVGEASTTCASPGRKPSALAQTPSTSSRASTRTEEEGRLSTILSPP